MFRNVFVALSFTFVIIVTSACDPNGPNDPAKTALANHVAEALSAWDSGNSSVSVAKLNTERGENWVVIKTGMSGYADYLAVNLDLINMSMDWVTMTDAFGPEGDGWEEVTPVGHYSNDYLSTWGNVYEDTGAAPKDLEKAAAAIERVRYNHIAQSIAANYGLSEERSYQVAQLSMQWNKLSQSRAMTDSDAESFSQDLFGVSITDAQAAYAKAQSGDVASYDALMTQAAAPNGVSPEQMSKIVSQVIAQ